LEAIVQNGDRMTEQHQAPLRPSIRLLAICDSPPTTDPRFASGSTLIIANLLSRLSDEIRLSLAYFPDRSAEPEEEIANRADAVVKLRFRGAPLALAATPMSRLPRASWQRHAPSVRSAVRRLALHSDVVFLHGLHTFALAAEISQPIVAHEVDPWSEHWRQRAASRKGLVAFYDSLQARRAEQLEKYISMRAASLVVVSPDDALRMGQRLDRMVTALPNGVVHAGRPPAPPELANRRTIAFVGSLNYPPNISAVMELRKNIFPLVCAKVPDARLIIAGRRPTAEILGLQSENVEIHSDVADTWSEIAGAAVMVFPGNMGFGKKNTLAEALGVGRPVVASRNSARGTTPGDHLVVVDSAEEQAAAVVCMLVDESVWLSACVSAAEVASTLPHWDDVGRSFNQLLREAAENRV
jgi:polysaccharide biosynthesis protein PslH